MIILEGTDAVGKSSVIERLSEYEIKDRDKNICSLMDFNLSLLSRVNKLVNYLEQIDDIVIFLINNDKEELERRISKREIIDEYDKYTYLYNLIYLETYTYIKQNNIINNLYMVDCTNLNIEEQTDKVKTLVNSVRR